MRRLMKYTLPSHVFSMGLPWMGLEFPLFAPGMPIFIRRPGAIAEHPL